MKTLKNPLLFALPKAVNSATGQPLQFNKGIFIMKLIPLTQGKFALVDDDDFEYLNQFKWLAHLFGKNYYADSGSKGLMHRFIMKAEKADIIDHKDRNSLNNQKTNLRKCTRSQNNANRKSAGINKYLGVTIQNNKFRA